MSNMDHYHCHLLEWTVSKYCVCVCFCDFFFVLFETCKAFEECEVIVKNRNVYNKHPLIGSGAYMCILSLDHHLNECISALTSPHKKKNNRINSSGVPILQQYRWFRVSTGCIMSISSYTRRSNDCV